MNIVPIPTLLFLQAIPFLLTLFALHFIIFKPMLSYLDQRDESIEGAKNKAKELEEKSVQKLEELNKTLKKTKSDLNEKRMAIRSELMAQYNDTIHKARQEADTEIKAQVAILSKEQEAARADLQNQAKKIAELVASQTLGRPISS